MKKIDLDFNFHEIKSERFKHDYFSVSLWDYNDTISVGLDAYSGEVELSYFLTPAEARELAESLIHFANQAEGDRDAQTNHAPPQANQ